MTPSFSDDTIHGRILAGFIKCRSVVDKCHAAQPFSYPVNLGPIIEEVGIRLGSPTAPFRIEPLCIPADEGNPQIFACLSRYSDHAKIFYRPRPVLNLCWKRYVVFKELCHLVIDSDDSFTGDPVALVEGLITDLPNLEKRPDLLSERLSHFIALELMFPWPMRAEIHRMHESGSSNLEIAHHCKFPEKAVITIVSKEHRNMSEFYNGIIDEMKK